MHRQRLLKPVNGAECRRLGGPKQLIIGANREGSNRATLVELQEATESFATLDLAAVVVGDHSAVDEFVSQPLMRALEMIVRCELVDRVVSGNSSPRILA